MDYRNGNQYHRNWILIGAFVLGLLTWVGTDAGAQSQYLSNSSGTGFTDVYPNTQGTRLDTCIVCHVQNSNGTRSNSRNPYGTAYGNGHNFGNIESLNSDGTGGTNIQEINALTFPGDPNDPPQSSNQAPSASNNSYSVNAGATLTVSAPGVLGNDSDPDGDSLSAVLGSGPSSGTLNLNANGSFTYTPTISDGSVSFTYRASDGSLTSSLATVTITVNPVTPANRAPSASGDSYSVDAGSTLTVSAPGVLGNDSDPDGDSLSAVLGSGPSSGTLNLNANGSFTYTPTISDGSVSFTYHASDGSLTSSLATVTITVNGGTSGNTPPVANDMTVTTNQDTPAGVTLTVSDADGDALTYDIISGPSNGTLSGTAPSLTYTPAAGYNGPDGFTYRASDGTDVSNVATVDITVGEEPPPPPGDTNVSLFPEDGAQDVPITTTVIVSVDGPETLPPVDFMLTESTPSSFAPESEQEDGAGGSQCVRNGAVMGTVAFDDFHTHVTFTPDCPLANGMTYTATITPQAGSQMPGLEQSITWTFTTIVQTADTDQDGVEDGEDERPDDDTEATPPRSKRGGKFHVSVGKNGHRHLRRVRGISDTHFSINQERRPRGYEFRDGLVDYEVHGISPGESVEVTIESPEEIPSESKVYMSDAKGFHELPAVISGNRFTMTVTDGGIGDSDGKADGVIVDPVGVAVPTDNGGGSMGASTDAAGGGCSVVGAGGGWKEAAGSYGLLTLVLLGLALRRRKPENGR